MDFSENSDFLIFYTNSFIKHQNIHQNVLHFPLERVLMPKKECWGTGAAKVLRVSEAKKF